MTDEHTPIAREGYKIIVVSWLLTMFIFIWSRPLGVACAFWTAFCLYFFRNPKRVAPSTGVVCPADGKIIGIAPAHEPQFLKRELKRVTIFMSPFNVHVNRAPVSGAVKGVIHIPGKFLAAFDERASAENERCACHVTDDDGRDFVFVQIAGWFARRIVCYLKPGDRTARGGIFGLIKFGSRMDVYLPEDYDVAVSLGQKVKAGESIIATKK